MLSKSAQTQLAMFDSAVEKPAEPKVPGKAGRPTKATTHRFKHMLDPLVLKATVVSTKKPAKTKPAKTEAKTKSATTKKKGKMS